MIPKTYTMLSMDVLDEVGTIKTPYATDLELRDGRRVKAEMYVAVIRIRDREGPAIITTFKDVKQVLGTQTLESIGLRLARQLEDWSPRDPEARVLL